MRAAQSSGRRRSGGDGGSPQGDRPIPEKQIQRGLTLLALRGQSTDVSTRRKRCRCRVRCGPKQPTGDKPHAPITISVASEVAAAFVQGTSRSRRVLSASIAREKRRGCRRLRQKNELRCLPFRSQTCGANPMQEKNRCSSST